jgi:hypothetical protein
MMTGVLPSLVLSLSILAVPVQVVSKPPLRENAEASLREALRLIEAKDYRTFLLEFMPPEFVKTRTKSAAALDEWVEYFAKQGVVYTLPKIKEASKVTPTYDEAKTTATFPLKEYDGTKWYKLLKIGKYWYVDPMQ